MSDDAGPPQKRVKLSKDDLDRMTKEEMMEKWSEQEAFIEALMSRQAGPSADELAGLRESEEKLKQQQSEATRRENILVMRLTAKEQEMQECLNQIQELKSVQSASMAQLRSTLLDPAVNIMFQRMKKETDASKEKLEQAQNDLTAWKFTPDSQTGKRLMAKCRLLLQENEELGNVISSGRTAKLQGEIALQKKFVEEMKKSQAETDEFLVEMDEDVEGMQSTIYYLQQQLKETKAELASLQTDNEKLRAETQQGNGSLHARDPLPSSPMDTQSDDNVRTTDTGNDADCSSPTDSSPQINRTERTDALCSSAGSQSTRDHGHPVQVQQVQTSNGDHHVSMEMDSFEHIDEGGVKQEQRQEQQQQQLQHSCDDIASTDRQNPDKQTTGSIHNNASHLHRASLSSADGAYTTEGTDVSNDAWSPMPSKQTSDALSDDDDVDTDNTDSRLVSSEQPRTDSKGETLFCGDSLQNGLVLARQYDSEGTENDP